MSPDLHRKNVRTAWTIAAFAALMFLSSIPFWKGLYNIAMHSGL